MLEEKCELESNVIAYLGIKDYEKVNHGLIAPKVKEFFSTIGNISSYKPIDNQAPISDLDITKANGQFFPHFYEHIVDKIHKNKEEKIQIEITYCITFDETNCSKICETTGIKYDEISLYNHPVFYFIYIDIREIFSFLRRNR